MKKGTSMDLDFSKMADSSWQDTMADSSWQDSMADSSWQDTMAYSSWQDSMAYSSWQDSMADSSWQDSMTDGTRNWLKLICLPGELRLLIRCWPCSRRWSLNMAYLDNRVTKFLLEAKLNNNLLLEAGSLILDIKNIGIKVRRHHAWDSACKILHLRCSPSSQLHPRSPW